MDVKKLTLPTAIWLAVVWAGSQKDEGESATFIGQVEQSKVSPVVETSKYNLGHSAHRDILDCFHHIHIFRLSRLDHVSPYISALNYV